MRSSNPYEFSPGEQESWEEGNERLAHVRECRKTGKWRRPAPKARPRDPNDEGEDLPPV